MPIYKVEGKKDGKQKYRVRVSYQDTQGNYKQIERTAYGKEEAKELESKLLIETKESPTGKMTFEQLFDEYIISQSSDVRKSTIDKVVRHINNYVIPQFAKKRIDKLSTRDMQEWKNYINSCKTKNDEGFSLKYRQNLYGTFSAIFNYAVKMEYINTNPLAKLGNFKDANTIKSDMEFYTPAEFKKFIDVAKIEAERSETNTSSIYEWNYYMFFMIAFFTGMRKGEINALKWSDLKNDKFDIRRSITQKVKGNDIETPPKNKSSIRVIQLPTQLIDALKCHENHLKTNGIYNKNNRICGGEKCLRDTSIENRNKKYAELAGIKKIRIHDFRHSHASYLINQNINIKIISKRLGHSKVEQTWNTYAHLYSDAEDIAINALNNIEI